MNDQPEDYISIEPDFFKRRKDKLQLNFLGNRPFPLGLRQEENIYADYEFQY